MAQFVTIIHDCRNFETWKKVYDGDAMNRKAAGLRDVLLAREDSNPNRIGLMFAVSDLSKAREMTASEGLRERMREGGIIGTPQIHFRQGEFADRQAPHYLTLNCRVSGIDTFKKGYAMDQKDRKAASLTDLGLLQDIEDPNDLLLIWSIDDMSKATAFLKSPALKEHQVKNAGLVGEPVARFWRR